jgi:aminopeptidase N
MNERARTIERIRKLRALAAGAGTRKEAEAAAGKAFDLKQQHAVAEGEIVFILPQAKSNGSGHRVGRPTRSPRSVGPIEQDLVADMIRNLAWVALGDDYKAQRRVDAFFRGFRAR